MVQIAKKLAPFCLLFLYVFLMTNIHERALIAHLVSVLCKWSWARVFESHFYFVSPFFFFIFQKCMLWCTRLGLMHRAPSHFLPLPSPSPCPFRRSRLPPSLHVGPSRISLNWEVVRSAGPHGYFGGGVGRGGRRFTSRWWRVWLRKWRLGLGFRGWWCGFSWWWCQCGC